MVSLIPVLSVSPSYIDTGMVRAGRKTADLTISNTGQEPLRNARIEGPSTSWMTLTVNKAMGDIAAGEKRPIGLMFSPPETVAQGVYDDKIVIYSDNHIPYTCNIQVTVTSDAVGNVLFDVLNELMEDVANATITFQHQSILELLYTVKTGPDGTAMKYDIPEGRYTFNVSPPAGHLPVSGSFVITPGVTTTVPLALEMNMVSISWSVEPVVIEDRYQIQITQTFETHVPTSVIVTEPPSINLPKMQPGQVFNGEFTISNYGLVAADYKEMQFPSSVGEYDIEVLATVPARLNAMQKVTVPYRVTRRQATASNQQSALSDQYAYNSSSENLPSPLFAKEGTYLPLAKGGKEGFYDQTSSLSFPLAGNPSSHYSQLLEEVSGYGGGVADGCSGVVVINTTFEQVICPNTPNEKKVKKTTGYVIVYNHCTTEDRTGTPSGGVTTGTTTTTYDEFIRQQTGGGGMPGVYTPITPVGDCASGSGGGGTGGTGGTGGGTGGTGGTGGSTATEDHRCSGATPIVVGPSAFKNGISVPSSGSNQVMITWPVNGLGVDKTRVIVKGAIDPILSGEQMMIETSRPGVTGTDSRFVAHLSGSYYAALAPLQAGQNNIKAIAKDFRGVQRDALVTVNATPSAESVLLTSTTSNEDLPTLKDSGATTLDVTLKAIPYTNNPIAKYSWDFNGDGITDLECSTRSTVTASFKETGLFLPTVTVTDTKGNRFTDTTIVNVLSKDNMNGMFKGIWNQMKGRLADRDVDGALGYYYGSSREKFNNILTSLIDSLPGIVADMKEIKMVYLGDNIAEYRISRAETMDGQTKEITYFIYFRKDDDGVWKIEGF